MDDAIQTSEEDELVDLPDKTPVVEQVPAESVSIAIPTSPFAPSGRSCFSGSCCSGRCSYRSGPSRRPCRPYLSGPSRDPCRPCRSWSPNHPADGKSIVTRR